MSKFVLDCPGKTHGIIPVKCSSRAQPQRFRKAVVVGPIKSVSLLGTTIDREYNDTFEASVTDPKFAWILANATSPIAVELWPGIRRTTNSPVLILVVGFSKAADERAFAAAEKAGIV